MSAALMAVAAIGDLPAAGCGPASRVLPLVWAGERAAWPVAGMLIGIAAAGGVQGTFSIASEITIGILLATGTTVGSRLSGATAADAASLTLLVAAASVAVGGGLAEWFGGRSIAATSVWLLVCVLGWAWSRSQKAASETVLPEPHRAERGTTADVMHVDPLPANGPLRQTLTRLAMLAALAAMAGWLVLEPPVDHGSGSGQSIVGQMAQGEPLTPVQRAAAAWALFTATWFVGLAVPQATLQDGIPGARRWEVLMRTAAGAGNVRRGTVAPRPFAWNLRPGPVRIAGGVALSQAAILGWPIMVCAVLALPTPAAARLPLSIAIMLAGAAIALTALVAAGTGVRTSRETTFAAALALVVGVLATIAASFGDPRRSAEFRQPAQPGEFPPAMRP